MWFSYILIPRRRTHVRTSHMYIYFFACFLHNAKEQILRERFTFLKMWLASHGTVTLTCQEYKECFKIQMLLACYSVWHFSCNKVIWFTRSAGERNYKRWEQLARAGNGMFSKPYLMSVFLTRHWDRGDICPLCPIIGLWQWETLGKAPDRGTSGASWSTAKSVVSPLGGLEGPRSHASTVLQAGDFRAGREMQWKLPRKGPSMSKGMGAHGMLGEWHRALGHPARSLNHLLARCSPGTEVTEKKRLYSLSSRDNQSRVGDKKGNRYIIVQRGM